MIANLDIQLIAWCIAVLALAMSVYILLLYIPQRPNRWFSLNLLFLAINAYAIGMMAGALTVDEINPGLLLSACLLPAIFPGLLLSGLTLLKPTWLHGRWVPIRYFLQGLTFIPITIVMLDAFLGLHLIHKEMLQSSYPGGAIGILHTFNGPVGIILYGINIISVSIAACIVYIYLAGFDKSLSPLTHRLAWLLSAAQLAVTIFLLLPGNILQNGFVPLVGTIIYTFVFTYATYQLSTPEKLQRSRTREVKGRHLRELSKIDRKGSAWANSASKGINGSFGSKLSLESRLMLLILSACLPLMITVAVIINQRMSRQIRLNAENDLSWISQSIAQRITAWLDTNTRSLEQLARLDSIQNMKPEQQESVLQAMALVHPDYLVVGTIDLSGRNVSRSDSNPPENYSNRTWFQEIKTGASVAYQVTLDSNAGKPIFEIAVPVTDQQGALVGAGMLTIDPQIASNQFNIPGSGTTTRWYVLDAQNRMIFNPISSLTLRDYSHEAPVIRLRQIGGGENLTPLTPFKDNAGKEWLGVGDEMENGWAVIVEQQKSEIYQGVNRMTQIMISIIVIATALLLALLGLAIRHAILPVRNLTETASAIASGDLAQVARVDREDEIGILGRAVNAITSQLRNSNLELEKQIAERTLDLEVRSSYLQAAVEVSQIVASILDLDQLSQEVVNLIRERFGLFFVGLFQLDKDEGWVVLKAGTGKPGQTYALQGFRIPVGSGIIGWSIVNSQPRILVDTGGDMVVQPQNEAGSQFLADKNHSNGRIFDFPEVHSEAALPLRSRGQVIGALSLHSVIPGAFDKENISIYQILADQVAIALDNARLFAESQETLTTMQQIYGEMSRTAWEKLLHEQVSVSYRADNQGVSEVDSHIFQGADIFSDRLRFIESGETLARTGNEIPVTADEELPLLEIPIRVRGNVIGILDTHKTTQNPSWQPQEVAMVQTVADQLGLALESAQLYREAQYRAERERLIGTITTQMRESLDVETVIQTAAREILNALGLQDIVIHLSGASPQNEPDSEESTGTLLYTS